MMDERLRHFRLNHSSSFCEAHAQFPSLECLHLDSEWIHAHFVAGPRQPALLQRHIIQAAWTESSPEVTQPRRCNPHNRKIDIGPALVEHHDLDAPALGQRLAGQNILAKIIRCAAC